MGDAMREIAGIRCDWVKVMHVIGLDEIQERIRIPERQRNVHSCSATNAESSTAEAPRTEAQAHAQTHAHPRTRSDVQADAGALGTLTQRAPTHALRANGSVLEELCRLDAEQPQLRLERRQRVLVLLV